MQRITLLFSALSGMFSVGIGAFGAHALKPMLEATGRLATFETAVKYQFYHTLALLAIALLMQIRPHRHLNRAAIGMIIGIALFSGSLYVLCFSGIGILGAVTPLGGACFIVAWGLLFAYALQLPKK